jgi:hypothetical protein
VRERDGNPHEELEAVLEVARGLEPQRYQHLRHRGPIAEDARGTDAESEAAIREAGREPGGLSSDRG